MLFQMSVPLQDGQPQLHVEQPPQEVLPPQPGAQPGAQQDGQQRLQQVARLPSLQVAPLQAGPPPQLGPPQLAPPQLAPPQLPPPQLPPGQGAGQQQQGAVPLVVGQPGQGQGGINQHVAVNGNGMQNILFNANHAMQSAAMAQQQAGLAFLSCANLAKAQAKSDRWARHLEISQVKSQFKTPADKKVIFWNIRFEFLY